MLSIGSLFTYWSLKILLVVVLVFCGYGISYKQPKDFKVYAVLAALFYSLVQGLRWHRGQDYMHYYGDLTGNWQTPNPEILYKTIVELLSNVLQLPYWGSFIVYSLLLISSVLLIFKIYPKAAIWGLPLFFIITQDSSENIIRQYLAISFVIFAYYAFLKGKKILTFALLCCVPMIHLAGLIAVVAFLLLALFKMPLKRPWLLLCIYVAFYFFWDAAYFEGITKFISTLGLGRDTKMQSYLQNSARWFTREGSLSRVLGRNAGTFSLINNSAIFLSQIIIIYYGFKAQLADRRLQIVFYFSFIATIFNTISGDIEMYRRLYNWFVYLTPFLIGVALYKIPMKKFERYAVITILSVNYFFYSLLRQVGSMLYSGVAFVWNR